VIPIRQIKRAESPHYSTTSPSYQTRLLQRPIFARGTSTTLFSPRGASIAESRVGHPPPKRVRWRPHRGASQIMWKLHRAIPINRVLQEWPPPKASDVGQGTPDLQSGYPLNIRSVTGGALERPPHDSSLLRRAILIAIGQKLKAERDPPTDLTPELRNILRRLEEQKDNEK
jgi:hypothetical protein